MYICHITKTKIGGNGSHTVRENISKDPKKLLADAKSFCKKNYMQFMKIKESGFGREYTSKISPWTTIEGFKADTKEVYPKHNYKHLVATIIGCYGRPEHTVEISIYQIEEIK